MALACCITKAAHTLRICHSYVLLLNGNNGYANAALCYIILALAVLFSVNNPVGKEESSYVQA